MPVKIKVFQIMVTLHTILLPDPSAWPFRLCKRNKEHQYDHRGLGVKLNNLNPKNVKN